MAGRSASRSHRCRCVAAEKRRSAGSACLLSSAAELFAMIVSGHLVVAGVMTPCLSSWTCCTVRDPSVCLQHRMQVDWYAVLGK